MLWLPLQGTHRGLLDPSHTHTVSEPLTAVRNSNKVQSNIRNVREQPQIASFSSSYVQPRHHAMPPLNRQMQMCKMRFDITVSVCDIVRVCVCVRARGDTCKTHFKSKSGTSIISPVQVVESWEHSSF